MQDGIRPFLIFFLSFSFDEYNIDVAARIGLADSLATCSDHVCTAYLSIPWPKGNVAPPE